MKFQPRYIFVSVLLACTLLQGQNPCNITLRGLLRHAHDSSALSSAEIFIEKGHYYAISDANGSFEINKLCKGNCLLEVDLDSKHHVHFDLIIEKDTLITLYLEPHVFHDSQVLIEERRSGTNPALGRTHIEKSAGNDLSTMASGINGIRLLQNGNSINKPMAQGMYGLRLPISIDGTRMEGQQWGDDHAPEADALGFDEIEWIKDARALLIAADAPAGVLLFKHSQKFHPGEQDLKIGSGYSENGKLINLWGVLKKAAKDSASGSYTQFSVRRGGNNSAPDYILGNTGLFETGFQTGGKLMRKGKSHSINLSLFRNESGILSASHISSVSDLRQAIQRGRPYDNPDFTYNISKPRQLAAHLMLNYNRQSKHNELVIAGQYNLRREFDYHRTRSDNTPQLDLHLITLQVKQVFSYNNTKLGSVHYGYSSQLMLHRYFTYFLIPDYEAIQNAAFATHEKQWGRLSLTGSLRYDLKYLHASWNKGGQVFSEQNRFGNYAAMITLKKRGKRGLLALDLSRLWRNPWVNELYSGGVHHGNASYERGNKNLSSERGFKAQTRFEYIFRRIELNFIAYAQYFKDFILLSPDSVPVLTVRGAFPSYEYKQFNALYSGAAASFKFKLSTSFELSADADFIYGRNISENRYPSFLPPLQIRSAADYHRKYIQIHAEWVFSGKQPYYTPGTDYLPPPAAYSLFNAYIIPELTRKNRNWQLQLGVTNILNTSYRNYLDRFRYYADMPGRNIYIKLKFNLHHHEKHH